MTRNQFADMLTTVMEDIEDYTESTDDLETQIQLESIYSKLDILTQSLRKEDVCPSNSPLL